MVLASLAACGPGASDTTGQAASGAGTPLPPSWMEATWFVDPANVTGAASDVCPTGGPLCCTTSAKPCLTYQGVAAQWGTYSPRLRQPTSITFLSNHSDDTDPVYFNPLIEHGALVSIQGVLGTGQEAGAGTLSNVFPKNRATGKLLAATLPGGAAVGQLVVNTTHRSRAWIYKNAGTDIDWFLSEPHAPVSVPGGPPSTAEVDPWAEGDSVVLYNPVSVNLAELSPTLADATTPGANLTVYQLTAFSPPNEFGLAQLTVSATVNVNFVESSLQRSVDLGLASSQSSPTISNCDIASPAVAGTTEILGELTITGGQLRLPGFANLRGPDLIGDVILGGNCAIEGGSYQTFFVDTGVKVVVTDATLIAQSPPDLSTPRIWGPGGVDVASFARLEYAPGPNQAQAAFLQKGGLTINSSSTACAVDTAAGGAWRCGIPITPANLDAAVSAGGFGGGAAIPGGGSIATESPDNQSVPR